MSPPLKRQPLAQLRTARNSRLIVRAARALKVAFFAFACLTGAHVRPAKSVVKTEDPQIDDAVQTEPYGHVEVCFATTRDRLEDRVDRKRTIAQFGVGRARELTFGCHLVTYPLNMPLGDLNIAPLDADGLIKLEDRNDHYTIHSSEILTHSQFLDRVYQQTRNKPLTACVHGYNTTHEFSILEAAHLWNASSKTDRIVVFDFSSLGTLSGYLYDIDSVNNAQALFAAFLASLGRIAGAIDIRTQSLGATLILPGINIAHKQGFTPLPKIKKLLLAAPAINEDSFKDHLQDLDGLVSSVLVYCSPSDTALSFAAGAHQVPMVGHCLTDSASAPTLYKTRLDIIDVSTLSTCGISKFVPSIVSKIIQELDRLSVNCWHGLHRTNAHMLIDANLYLSGITNPDQRGGLFTELWSWQRATAWRARTLRQ